MAHPSHPADQPRRTDGKFAEIARAEDDGVALVEAATSDPYAVHAVTLINEACSGGGGLGGVAVYNGDGTVSYLDEDGASYQVSVSSNVMSVRSDRTDAQASTAVLRISGEQSEFEHLDRHLARLVKDAVNQDRDIRAFEAAAPSVWAAARVVTPANTTEVHVDGYYGTLTIEGQPGALQERVVLGNFNSADEDWGGSPTMAVTLDRAGSGLSPAEKGEQEFVLVHTSTAHGIPAYTYYRAETREPLVGWEARGLEAEINRRAGLTESRGYLPQVLMNAVEQER